MNSGGAAQAALMRAGDAVDDAIQSILASVEGGQGTRKDQALLLVDPQLHQILTMSPKIRWSVDDFLREFGTQDPQVVERLARALVGLEAALLRLKEAVEWTGKHSGEHWWIKRRQMDLRLERFVVLARPGNGQEWLTAPLLSKEYSSLIDLKVLKKEDVDLDGLQSVRLLTVPRFDGMDARWHPISLGHEVAHLLFTTEWTNGVLAGLDTSDMNRQAKWFVEDAGRPPQGRNAAFHRASSWLTEVACDTCMQWFYGDEGVRALEFFVGMSIVRDTEKHPHPPWRIELQLSGLQAVAQIRGGAASLGDFEEAFLDLAPRVIEAAREVLRDRTEEHFRMEESDRIRTGAVAALQSSSSPPSQHWALEMRQLRPSSIESGLIRCLWSTGNVLTSDSYRQAYYVIDESSRNRIEHAVNALQFSHLFSRSQPLTKAARKNDGGLAVNSVLWIHRDGIRTEAKRTKKNASPAMDVRLGRHFIVFRRNRISSLDFLEDSARIDTMQEMIEISWGKSLVLHPGELILGVTFESLVVQSDAAAQILSRSSLGRLGLLAATAVHVQPGFRGNLTLELVNLTSVPLRLTPGQRIAQLVAFSAAGRAQYEGGYQDANWRPRFSKIGGDEETQVLVHMFEDQFNTAALAEVTSSD